MVPLALLPTHLPGFTRLARINTKASNIRNSFSAKSPAAHVSGAYYCEPPKTDILRRMKVEEIAEAIAKLPPDQLARFRRWFSAFEAGRSDHAEELDSAATKLGRFAGRTFAELKKRAKEP